jgi:hypothetical protein
MTIIETNEQGETVIIVNTNPVYCSIRVDMLNGNECEIEGWLVADTIVQASIEIQPSVEFDPDGVMLAFPISQLLSVTPAIPKSVPSYTISSPAISFNPDIEAVQGFTDRLKEVLNSNG